MFKHRPFPYFAYNIHHNFGNHPFVDPPPHTSETAQILSLHNNNTISTASMTNRRTFYRYIRYAGPRGSIKYARALTPSIGWCVNYVGSWNVVPVKVVVSALFSCCILALVMIDGSTCSLTDHRWNTKVWILAPLDKLKIFISYASSPRMHSSYAFSAFCCGLGTRK